MPGVMLDFIAHFSRTTPNKLAAVDLASGRRWTYSEFDAAIWRMVHVLRERVGDTDGVRIATLSRNSVDMLVIHFACVRSGAIFVPLNWRLAAPEIEFLIGDCRPVLLVYEEMFVHLVPGTYAGRTLVQGESRDELNDAIAAAPQPERLGVGVAVEPDRTITLLYSSGTTGKPKGVIVTQMNAFAGGLNLCLGTQVTPASVFLCEMPLFHTAGLMAAARAPLLMGATVLVSQKFDAEVTYSRLADEALGITHYFSVTQMAMMMRQIPGFDGRKLSRLTAYVTGGAPNPEAHVKRWLDDGVPMLNGWGMSENSSCLAMPLGDFDRIRAKAHTVGVPHLTVEIRIVDPQGNEVPRGTVGELWTRGLNTTPGYWERPELNEKSFEDGWFKTGDAGFVDEDGFYSLVDRIKDMFISGGENVYPAEIEATITEMHDVGEVAVIGVPDARWGEVGCAFVVPAPGASLSPEQVIAHCKAQLAGYKVPKSVILTDSIPRTASGKVQKHLLREIWDRQAAA